MTADSLGQTWRPLTRFFRVFFACLLLAVALTATYLVLKARSPVILRLEHQLADWRTGLLSDRLPEEHRRIAVVLIDESTLRTKQYTSPIDREVLAQLVRKIDALGAKAIALDIGFFRPTEEAKDAELLSALHDSRAEIILAAGDRRTMLDDEERRFQRHFLDKAGRRYGYANVDEDKDEVLRRRLGPDPNGQGEFPKSFAAVIAEIDGKRDIEPSNWIAWLNKFDAAIAGLTGVNTESSTRIAWLKKPANGDETFFAVNALGVMAEGDVGAEVGSRLRDRLVLIGGGFPDRDLHRTPLFRRDAGGDTSKVHGIFLHAQVLAQILEGRSIEELPDWLVVFCVSLFGAYLGWSIHRHNLSWIVGFGWTAVLIVFDLILFWNWRVVVPYMPATMAWVVGCFGGYILRRANREWSVDTRA